MSRRGDAPTLAERAAAAAPAPPQEARPARTRPVVRRHCWVQGLGDAPGRWPGLLVEWRQAPDDDHASTGWQGRVVYVVSVGTAPPVVVEAWLAAGHLSPA